ncbi:MAG: hypothetical protein A2664_00735 [Candidatus Taylorbacteria bacterium RIFCSPHIGHO2_01_FULL_46_22b]|uniref:HD/PDEase domain-containing protein n=1 Tax=Candidatus Taylorbacteria bacterium RIFCSPHIGHO2_01_FULL_46_22b TaxID=1802301 RepID=A0A1G2M3H9_9BACT|nr:MAG: hypothetical protein A2664_00735 [Candidatus Taylorbacteria bacterium RIFCSPHIGHO2_01_FULL_46_22b]
MSLPKLWEKFSELTRLVREDHRNARHLVGHGHDFAHALMVAQYAQLIASEQHEGELGWAAGLMHNTDHLFGEEKVNEIMEGYLVHVLFSPADKNLVCEAVLTHSEIDSPKDNPISIILKDADKLANIGESVILRSGQFRPDITAMDPRFLKFSDPKATYRNPRSLLQDLRHILQWETMMRTEKARMISKPYFDRLRSFIDHCPDQFEESGLTPYPFPEDFESSN